MLIRSLDDAWRIYLQPAVGGTRPDVVVIHPKAGIQIIEVKDYDMSAYDVSGKTWEVHTSGGLKTVRCPFRQADTARSALFRILLPPVEEMRAENKKGSDYQWNKIVRL